MKTYISGAALAAISLLALSGTAFAQTASGTGSDFTVSISIEEACTLLVGGDLAFSSSGYFDTDIQQTTTINVSCTPGTTFVVGLDAGDYAGSAPGGASRAMKHETEDSYIGYDLYHGSAEGTAWGMTEAGGWYEASTYGDITVYGIARANTTAPVGDYSDTVTATIWYGSGIPSGG